MTRRSALLVTGGAGYVGSHVSLALRDAGYPVVVLDDLSTGTGPVWARPYDARTTAVGRLLRRFHLDELPQVVNVLRGEMSLVGPRPERPELAARIERACPGFARRLAVRPGLAGLAQARGGIGHRSKLRYDLVYIGAMGPWLDIRLCAACVWRALLGPRRPGRNAAARHAGAEQAQVRGVTGARRAWKRRL